MIRRNGDLLLEDDATRAARTRRASLYRAALALAVMSALLVGLLMEDEAVAPDGGVPLATLDAPVVGTPEVAMAPLVLPRMGEKQHAESSSPAVPATSEVVAMTAPAGDEAARADPVPVTPDVVADVPVAVPAPAAPKAPEKEIEKMAAVPSGSAPAASAAPAEGVAAPDGFRLQLGQFVDMRPATTLRDALMRQGYAARLQVRVGVGPYAQRKAAESALAKMRSERAIGGLIVVPPSGKGLIVQLGVFSEQRNADELAARMKGWGYAAQLHARVVVGPYPDQPSAQAALQKLQRERALESAVILPAT